jgi:hypothetical protein
MFDEILEHNYDKVNIGVFFNLVSDYGVKLKPEPLTIQPRTSQNQVTTLPKVEKIVRVKPGPWSDNIAELESFFKSISLPNKPIMLDQASKIIDLPKLIESHLSVVRAQNGNERYLPYLERLNEVRDMLRFNVN